MPKANKDTRERLLQSAMGLFHEKGYAAAGMAEILGRAEANSGSFYYFFRNKEDLLLSVLQRYEEGLYPMLLDPIWKSSPDPIERIFKLLAKYRELLVASNCTYGCPIGRLALEIDPAQEEVNKGIARNFEGWADAVEKCLEEATAQGTLPPEVKPERLARFVLCVMEGAVMQARSHRSPKPFDMAVDELAQYFDTLVASGADV